MPGAGTFPKWSAAQEVRPSGSRICWQEINPALGGLVYGQIISASITATVGDFYWRDDAGANDGDEGRDFCKALGDAMTAASAVGDGAGLVNAWTWTVRLRFNGTIQIKATDGGGGDVAFVLRMDAAAAAAVGGALAPEVLGYTAAQYVTARAAGNQTHTSPRVVAGVWAPEQAYVDDTEEFPVYNSTTTRMMSGRQRVLRWGQRYRREVEIDFLPGPKIFAAEAVTTGEAFESFFAFVSQGTQFEFARDWMINTGSYAGYTGTPTNPATLGRYVIDDAEWIQQWPTTVPHETIRRWALRFPMQRYVSPAS